MARIVLEIDVPDDQLEDALAHVKRNLPRAAEVVHECTYDRFYTGSIVENWRESAQDLHDKIRALDKKLHDLYFA